MQQWQKDHKAYPTEGQPRPRKRNGPNKKMLAKDSNNIGYSFRRMYRHIYGKAYILVNELKDPKTGKITINDEKREVLINKLLEDEFLKGHTNITQKIVDNVIFMLMRNGDLVTTDIEKAECFATHKEIIDKSLEEKQYAVARSANRDLMEIYELFPKPQESTDNLLIQAMKKKLDGSTEAITMATGPEFLAMLWEGKKLIENKKHEASIIQMEILEDKKDEE